MQKTIVSLILFIGTVSFSQTFQDPCSPRSNVHSHECQVAIFDWLGSLSPQNLSLLQRHGLTSFTPFPGNFTDTNILGDWEPNLFSANAWNSYFEGFAPVPSRPFLQKVGNVVDQTVMGDMSVFTSGGFTSAVVHSYVSGRQTSVFDFNFFDNQTTRFTSHGVSDERGFNVFGRHTLICRYFWRKSRASNSQVLHKLCGFHVDGFFHGFMGFVRK